MSLWPRFAGKLQRVWPRFVLFLSMVLAGCATLPGSEHHGAWYEGTQGGEIEHRDQAMAVTVTCDASLMCGRWMTNTSGGKATRNFQRIDKARLIEPRLLEIANNNLRQTRNYVKAHPAGRPDSMDDEFLRAITPVLQSSAEFSACVDISSSQLGEEMLCRLTLADKGLPPTVLLIGLMQNTCNRDSPFCAYMYMPMQRVEAKALNGKP